MLSEKYIQCGNPSSILGLDTSHTRIPRAPGPSMHRTSVMGQLVHGVWLRHGDRWTVPRMNPMRGREEDAMMLKCIYN